MTEEECRSSFAELFRRLIEFELPPAEKFRKILKEVLRITKSRTENEL